MSDVGPAFLAVVLLLGMAVSFFLAVLWLIVYPILVFAKVLGFDLDYYAQVEITLMVICAICFQAAIYLVEMDESEPNTKYI
jgi:hypothetical protein